MHKQECLVATFVGTKFFRTNIYSGQIKYYFEQFLLFNANI